MPTYDVSTGLRALQGGNVVADIDAGFLALAQDVSAAMARYAAGTFAARPSAGTAGRFYRATDTGDLYLDTGTVWIPVNGPLDRQVVRGASDAIWNGTTAGAAVSIASVTLQVPFANAVYDVDFFAPLTFTLASGSGDVTGGVFLLFQLDGATVEDGIARATGPNNSTWDVPYGRAFQLIAPTSGAHTLTVSAYQSATTVGGFSLARGGRSLKAICWP